MAPVSTIVALTLPEPGATAVLLTILGVLVAVSVLFSRAMDRLGVPIVLLFLVLGMIGGSEGLGGIHFDDYRLAVRLGTAALVLILFDGGLNTTIADIRQVLYPAGLLATVGVIATAVLVALFARLLNLSWPEALLLGAVVSSTDAAAVLAVLRGGNLHLRSRVGRTLEVESCVNDPMAVILTATVIQFIAVGELSPWRLTLLIPLQLAIGGGVGLVIGLGARWLLRRIRLPTVGLYPAMTLAIAFISFGSATLVSGSGFLSVFVTAVVLGNSPLPYRSGLTRIHDAVAWMSQIGMFLMLGLLVYPAQLLDVAVIGLGVGLFLALIGRPLAVIPWLLPFRYSAHEITYISWVGLRGAVPIILATFPVLHQVTGAERIFHLVFFIVVVSSIIPGATIRWLSRRFDLTVKEKPAPLAALEINSPYQLNGELVAFYIDKSLAVCDARLQQIEFPAGSAVVLVLRGKELLAARGSTVLQEGDHAYVFFRSEDRPFIELLFGRPEE